MNVSSDPVPVKLAQRPANERYYGVDISEDGALVVAARPAGRAAPVLRYPAGAAGVTALSNQIALESAHPHVCIRSRGAVALSLSMALIALPGAEVTLVARHAIERTVPSKQGVAANQSEERAQRLAQLAERMF
jgi:hypothetical protein